MQEVARLSFYLGRILATYDKHYLVSESHRDEIIAIHLQPLLPTPEAVTIIRAVLKEEYAR